MRLHLLNANQSQAVVVGIFYTSPMRLDIYIDGMYIAPTNAYYEDGKQLRHLPQPGKSWLPDVTSDPSGTNYFNREKSTLYVLVRNSFPVDIRTTPVVFLCFQFPDMTLDEFYGINLVNNLAIFLGIPPEKIKIARATRESRNRRRRRNLETLNVDVEISNDPRNLTEGEMNPVSAREYAVQTSESVSQINGTEEQVQVANTTNQGTSPPQQSTMEPQGSEVDCTEASRQDKADPNSQCYVPFQPVVMEDELSYEELQKASASVVEAVQTGTIDEAVNTTVLNVAVVDPVPSAADLNSTDAWAEISEKLENSTGGGIAALATSIQIPAILEILVVPVLMYEGSTFGAQSSLHFLDGTVSILLIYN